MSTRTLVHIIRPFADHLADPATTDIVVNQPGHFGVARGGRWEFFAAPSLTLDVLDSIGVLAGYDTGKDFSPAAPLCATILPNGERLQVCRPPATMPGIISLTVRKPSERAMLIDDDDFTALFSTTNARPARWNASSDLLRAYYERKDWREFFKLAIVERKSIGVCGAMGTGKTELLKRFLRHIPANDRVVTVEDTSEFKDAGPPNKVALFYDTASLTAEAVLKAALRMSARRLIFQEVRGPEAFAFLRGLMQGHSSYTSWHAEEGHEWDALSLMVRQHEAGRAIPPEDMRRYLEQFLDILVWVAKEDTEYRAPRVWFREMSA